MDKILDWIVNSVKGSILNQMLHVGADLMSEEGENPEYDRAVVDLIVGMCWDELPALDEPEAKKEYVRHALGLIKVQKS